MSVKGLLLGMAGIGGVFALGSAVAFGGVKAAAKQEQDVTAFKTMLGGGEAGKQKADVLFGQVNKFAAETPYELPELTSATRKLLAFGSSSKTVVDDLKMIGDVASGVSQPIGEIAEIYGKARVQGRLFAEDVNQFTGRGIPILKHLAEQFGVTEGEVKKLVEKGKVGFPELEKAFKSMTSDGGQFYKMMEEQSKTASGLWSTLSDNVHMVGREIASSLMPAVKALLSYSIDLTANASSWVDPLKTKLAGLSGQFVAAMPVIAGWVSSAWTYASAFGSMLAAMQGAYLRFNLRLAGGLATLLGGVKGLGRGFLDAMDNLKFFFDNFETFLLLGWEHTKLFTSNSFEHIKTFFQNIGIVLAWLWDNWKSVFQTIWDFTRTTIENLGKNLGEFFIAVKNWMSGKGFDFKWTGLLEGFESSLSEMPAMMRAKVKETTPELEKLYDELGREDRKRYGKEGLSNDLPPGYKPGGADDDDEKKKEGGAGSGKFGHFGLAEFAKHLQQGVSSKEREKEDRDKKKTKAAEETAKNTKRAADAAERNAGGAAWGE